MKNKGQLYLIPCPIAENQEATIPKYVLNILHNLQFFVVERARTSRRYIKSSGYTGDMQSLEFYELDKRKAFDSELHIFLKKLEDGIDVGLLSEAGCPGIADPGNQAVQFAHRSGIKVIPLVGPSSILLSLMASGLNGQSFTFHGYLPNKSKDLNHRLKQLEQDSLKTGYTHIFMDAPYRNAFLMEHCIAQLNGDMNLCIAVDLTAESEVVMTKKVKEWQGFDFNIFHKRPALVLIGR